MTLRFYLSDDDLGCSVNALTYLDKACSGKPTCEYFAVDKELALTKPCPVGRQSFLEIQYDCITGMTLLIHVHNYYISTTADYSSYVNI